MAKRYLGNLRLFGTAQYSLEMIAIRLSVVFLLATLAVAQQAPNPQPAGSDSAEPKLPMIDDRACPLETNPVLNLEIQFDDHMYSSWQDKRVPASNLHPRERVTVLRGVNIIREPAKAVVVHPIHRTDGLSLKAGDNVLRYGLNAAQNWEFWAKGSWFTEYIENVAEKGVGCKSEDYRGCPVEMVKNGVQEWWVQVKTGGAQRGSVLAEKITGDKSWSDSNFAGLCLDDGDD